jgi:hypothetical protein
MALDPMTPKQARVFWVVALLLAPFGLWRMGRDLGWFEAAPANPRADSAQIVPAGPRPPVVKRDHFNRITEGMSYADVERIIGVPGEELSRSSLAGTTTVMYQWTNSNGTGMNAMFQGGKLVTKAQYGLP